MYRLWMTVKKDFWLLTRDRVGLLLIFAMPIVLVILITSVQNSTFELVNANTVKLLLCNRDTGEGGRQLSAALQGMGIFRIYPGSGPLDERSIRESMHDRDAVVGVVIPKEFSGQLSLRAQRIASIALRELGLSEDSLAPAASDSGSVQVYFHPVLQSSFRQSIRGALVSALQLVQSRELVRQLYGSLHDAKAGDSLQGTLDRNQPKLEEISLSPDGSRQVPNATQHNVPAWTIFAMFFIVIPLGGSVVTEKRNGSFLRLKTLPTSFVVALLSKQLTYLAVTLAQALVIFALGLWLFPRMGLPALSLPRDIGGFLLVTLISGWCAVSFAICIGVLASTTEQANGFGSVFIVILAAIGGLLVPSFAMPASFSLLMKMSPLHWCLEAYYDLFLVGSALRDIVVNILSLVAIILVVQLITLAALKRKNLI
jgi:ABC-2 type transport system permease protein